VKKNRIALLILTLVAVAARVPGILWGVDLRHGGPFVFYSYDEFAVIEAMLRVINAGKLIARSDYFYGFAFEMLPVVALVKAIGLSPITPHALIAVRLANLLFAVATVHVTVVIARAWFREERIAWLAGFLLALFPLHVIHSHAATPVVSGVFWAYLCFAAAISYGDRPRRAAWWLACAASGAAIAVKFLFITWIPLSYLLVTMKEKPAVRVAGIAMMAGAFTLFNLGVLPWAQLPDILSVLAPDNFGGRSHHYWTTPLMYLIALVPGLGLASFVASMSGGARMLRDGLHRHRFFCLQLPLAVHFITICLLSASFIRHAVPLLPFLAVLSAAGAVRIWTVMEKRSRRAATALALTAVLYQAATVAWIEAQHVAARGAEARHWLITNAPAGKTVALAAKQTSDYRNLFSLPAERLAPSAREADYLVLSEGSALLPFRRSILNPLTDRPAPGERYGWDYLEDPDLIEAVAQGSPSYRRAAFFPVKEVIPEFVLYKRLFGTHNWLEGDFSIFERTGPPL